MVLWIAACSLSSYIPNNVYLLSGSYQYRHEKSIPDPKILKNNRLEGIECEGLYGENTEGENRGILHSHQFLRVTYGPKARIEA